MCKEVKKHRKNRSKVCCDGKTKEIRVHASIGDVLSRPIGLMQHNCLVHINVLASTGHVLGRQRESVYDEKEF
jgi:hypothetical protein